MASMGATLWWSHLMPECLSLRVAVLHIDSTGPEPICLPFFKSIHPEPNSIGSFNDGGYTCLS